MNTHSISDRVCDLVQAMCAACEGQEMGVVAAAAADFAAVVICLAEREHRARLLAQHCETVRFLIPVNAKLIHDEDLPQ